MSDAPAIAARFRRFLAEQRMPPDRRAAAEAAIEAFVAFAEGQEPSALDPLVVAARSPHKAVYETGALLLSTLAGLFEPAQRRWRALAEDKSATARFHAIAYLEQPMPESLCLEVLRLGLRDASARVRAKAVEGAEGHALRVLLPELEEMQRHESDTKVRAALAFHLPILRDGYALDSPASDRHYVRFRLPGALVSAPLHGKPTPEAIAALIAAKAAERRGA